jgi:Rap1a immunity proteins
MKIKLRVLAFVAIVAMSVSSPAKAAAVYDGNEILFSCEQGHLRCIYYLAGVQDVWNDLDSKKYCMPDGVKLTELKEVFVKYAKENPEKLYLAASSVTINAFNKAFPCE